MIKRTNEKLEINEDYKQIPHKIRNWICRARYRICAGLAVYRELDQRISPSELPEQRNQVHSKLWYKKHCCQWILAKFRATVNISYPFRP